MTEHGRTLLLSNGVRVWARELGHDHYVFESGMTSNCDVQGLLYGDVVLAVAEDDGQDPVVRERVVTH